VSEEFAIDFINKYSIPGSNIKVFVIKAIDKVLEYELLLKTLCPAKIKIDTYIKKKIFAYIY